MHDFGQFSRYITGPQEHVHSRLVNGVEGEGDLQGVGGPEQAVKGPRIPGEPVHPSIGTVGTPVFGVTDSRDAEHQVRRNGTSHPSGRGIA